MALRVAAGSSGPVPLLWGHSEPVSYLMSAPNPFCLNQPWDSVLLSVFGQETPNPYSIGTRGGGRQRTFEEMGTLRFVIRLEWV